jgi:phosphotransferase system enzyme I (PtsI)
MSFTLHGLPVSGGIAIGQAHADVARDARGVAPDHRAAHGGQGRSLASTRRCKRVRQGELEAMKGRTEHAPAEFGAFIDIHTMFLEDPELADKPREIIRERRCNAEWALVQQMEHLVGQFEKFDDPYLRERKLRRAAGRRAGDQGTLGHPGRRSRRARGQGRNLIVVAHDLSPADVIAFKEHHFASFITDVGGATSHTAILARSLAIPAVLGLDNAAALIRDKEVLIVDGTRGVVIVNPDQRILEEYQLRKSQIELERIQAQALKTARSADASTGRHRPARQHRAARATCRCARRRRRGRRPVPHRVPLPRPRRHADRGRTVRGLPQGGQGHGGRPVTIRTFDLGNDKDLHPTRSATACKTNPALGRRAIRLSLAEPKMFQTQLRAILRASKYGKIKLLIPMLAHAHEIDQTLAAWSRPSRACVAKIPSTRTSRSAA